MKVILDVSTARQHPLVQHEIDRSTATVKTLEPSLRACLCPRCALTVARPEDLSQHLGVCSGTS